LCLHITTLTVHSYCDVGLSLTGCFHREDSRCGYADENKLATKKGKVVAEIALPLEPDQIPAEQILERQEAPSLVWPPPAAQEELP
jgi:hypothetical protein